MPARFDFVGCDSVNPSPAKMSLILPILITGSRFSASAFKIVRGGFIEKSRRISVLRKAPACPANGRAITRPIR